MILIHHCRRKRLHGAVRQGHGLYRRFRSTGIQSTCQPTRCCAFLSVHKSERKFPAHTPKVPPNSLFQAIVHKNTVCLTWFHHVQPIILLGFSWTHGRMTMTSDPIVQHPPCHNESPEPTPPGVYRSQRATWVAAEPGSSSWSPRKFCRGCEGWVDFAAHRWPFNGI